MVHSPTYEMHYYVLWTSYKLHYMINLLFSTYSTQFVLSKEKQLHLQKSTKIPQYLFLNLP
jgi:hypothetical protein